MSLHLSKFSCDSALQMCLPAQRWRFHKTLRFVCASMLGFHPAMSPLHDAMCCVMPNALQTCRTGSAALWKLYRACCSLRATRPAASTSATQHTRKQDALVDENLRMAMCGGGNELCCSRAS